MTRGALPVDAAVTLVRARAGVVGVRAVEDVGEVKRGARRASPKRSVRTLLLKA